MPVRIPTHRPRWHWAPWALVAAGMAAGAALVRLIGSAGTLDAPARNSARIYRLR